MRRSEYHPTKGMRFLRCGGLSFVKQDNIAAPEKYGLWAFIWPYFDFFFIGGKQSKSKFPNKDKFPCSEDSKWNKEAYRRFYKPRDFWYSGPIYSHIEVPGSEIAKGFGGGLGGMNWFRTDTKSLFQHLGKIFAEDLETFRKWDIESCSPKWRDKIFQYYMENKKPIWGNGMNSNGGISMDHLEVFIPRGLVR